jgi:hypothetical protein
MDICYKIQTREGDPSTPKPYGAIEVPVWEDGYKFIDTSQLSSKPKNKLENFLSLHKLSGQSVSIYAPIQ